MYRLQAVLIPPAMSVLFVTQDTQIPAQITLHKPRATFGTEAMSCRGPQIWNLIPERLRRLPTLKKIKK